MACNTTTIYWSGVDFLAADALWTNAALTTPAPDGWYSYGGYYRQISGGVLGPSVSCPTCTIPCSQNFSATGTQGKFTGIVNVGTNTGIVVVKFNTFFIPDSFKWTYDGDYSQAYTNYAYGHRTGLVGSVNGGLLGPCVSMEITNPLGSNGGATTGSIFEWDGSTPPGVFVNTGNTITLGPFGNQATGQVDLLPVPPGTMTMAIPKPNAFPSEVDFEVIGPCQTTSWNATVYCPATPIGHKYKIGNHPCTDVLPDVFYNVSSLGTGISDTVRIHDLVFVDANGTTPLPAGDYTFEQAGSGVKACMTVTSYAAYPAAGGVPVSIITTINNCSGSCP